jgi:hypothetical protein
MLFTLTLALALTHTHTHTYARASIFLFMSSRNRQIIHIQLVQWDSRICKNFWRLIVHNRCARCSHYKLQFLLFFYLYIITIKPLGICYIVCWNGSLVTCPLQSPFSAPSPTSFLKMEAEICSEISHLQHIIRSTLKAQVLQNRRWLELLFNDLFLLFIFCSPLWQFLST